MDEFQRSLALVVGIDDYAHAIPPLRTAVRDARRLASLLQSEHGYTVFLLTEDASLQRLRTLLAENLPAQVSSHDRLLFYFAGHGIALDGEDGPAGYLVPQDARPEDRDTFLPMSELHQALSALPCRHLLAILDCCFAGAFRWASTRDVLRLPPVIHRERYDRFLRDPAWQVLTSAAYDQRALDQLAGDAKRGVSRAEGGAHSPFALALFEALAGAGDVVPGDHGDGVITATELYLYLRDAVEVQADEQAHHRQTPGLWPLQKHDKGEYIFLVPGHELNLPPAPELTFDNNPWRGLKSYDERHKALFFGREEEIAELAELVSGQALTVVLGASGTGKSSLVKAGLLPRLGGSAPVGGPPSGQADRAWLILPPLRPGATPLRSLYTLLSSQLPDLAQAEGLDRLHTPPTALARVVGAWGQAHPGRKLMLVVDQCEELVTLCRSKEECTQFLTLLARAVEAHRDTFRLVLTLRTDFEPQLAQDTPLTPLWPDARYVVPAMDQDDLRQVIEGPASVRVLYFEPHRLVDSLINEVIQTPGALPLLSFTLSELYVKYLRRQDVARRAGETLDRALTEADYHQLGGVVGSLRSRANEEYDALPGDAHRTTMQRVMLRMVAVEGGELARRRVPRSELVYPDEAENERVDEVIGRLVAARLVVEGREDGGAPSVDGEAYVEPAHDALVRAWDRLLIWKREAEDVLPLQRRVTQAARDWAFAVDKKVKRDLLWHDDPRLAQLQDTLTTTRARKGQRLGVLGRLWQSMFPATEAFKGTTWLNRQETSFVRESIRQRGQNLRRIVGIALAVLLALSALAGVASVQWNAAVKSEATAVAERDQRATAQAETQAAANAEATAAAIAIAEADQRATAQANEAQARQLAETRRAEAEEQARLALSRELAASAVSQLPLDAELGRLLALEAAATAGTDEAERALRQAILSPLHTVLRGHRLGINNAAFSPDGRWAVTAGIDRATRVWDTTTWTAAAVLPGNYYGTANETFSSDGRIMAIDGPETRTAWDTTTWQQVAVPADLADGAPCPGLAGDVVACSPDGRLALVGDDTGQPAILETATGKVLFQLGEDYTQLTGRYAFSPDGQWLIAVKPYADRAELWEIPSGSRVATLPGHTGPILDVAFSPDSQLVATVSNRPNDPARVWNVLAKPLVGQAQPLAELRGHASWLNTARFSPDGRLLITSSDDNTARVWEVEAGQTQSGRFQQGRRTGTYATAFSPDGPLVAVRSDTAVALWNVQTGNAVAELPAGAGAANRMAFSVDGTWLATTGEDGLARVWDVGSQQLIGELGEPGSRIIEARFSPDNALLATNSVDAGDDATAMGKLQVWDLQSEQVLHALEVSPSWLSPPAISPDGKLVVTASGYEAKIWETTSGQLRPLVGHTVVVHSAAFSPDGELVVTASGDQTAKIWETATGRMVADLLGHSDWVYQATFSPDGRFVLTASEDHTARLWEVETGQSLLVFRGHRSAVHQAVFSPDGRRIMTAGDEGTVQIFDCEVCGGLEELVSLARARVFRELTCEERQRFLHEQTVCP